jgi:hypothetical protein
MFILWSYSPVEVSYGSENVFLVLLLSFRGSGLVTSNTAVGGGRHPLPVPAYGGPGAPPPTAAEVAQASHQSLRRNTRKDKGEAGKQRASEQPLCAHLRPAGVCMKMWRLLIRDTAIRWRENAAASATPSPQRRTGVSERTTVTLEPSFHFESRFSGVQLLVVEEPPLLAYVSYNIFKETPDSFSSCFCPTDALVSLPVLGRG